MHDRGPLEPTKRTFLYYLTNMFYGVFAIAVFDFENSKTVHPRWRLNIYIFYQILLNISIRRFFSPPIWNLVSDVKKNARRWPNFSYHVESHYLYVFFGSQILNPAKNNIKIMKIYDIGVIGLCYINQYPVVFMNAGFESNVRFK